MENAQWTQRKERLRVVKFSNRQVVPFVDLRPGNLVDRRAHSRRPRSIGDWSLLLHSPLCYHSEVPSERQYLDAGTPFNRVFKVHRRAGDRRGEGRLEVRFGGQRNVAPPLINLQSPVPRSPSILTVRLALFTVATGRCLATLPSGARRRQCLSFLTHLTIAGRFLNSFWTLIDISVMFCNSFWLCWTLF